MFGLRSLEERCYEGKACVRFTYRVAIENEEPLVVWFMRKNHDSRNWTLKTIIETYNGNHSYVFSFAHPSSRCNLESIAAYGLRILQSSLQREIQSKSNIDFAIGDAISGM